MTFDDLKRELREHRTFDQWLKCLRFGGEYELGKRLSLRMKIAEENGSSVHALFREVHTYKKAEIPNA